MKKNKSFLKRKLFLNILIIMVLFLSAILFVASRYKNTYFSGAQIDEMIFYFNNGIADGRTSNFLNIVVDNLFTLLIVFFVLLIPVIDFYRNRINIKFNLAFLGKVKNIAFNPSHVSLNYKMLYAIVVFLISIWLVASSFGVIGYVKAIKSSSTIFEEKYIDPRKSELVFPEQKRNLIYIHLESVENTLLSREVGGQADISLIPELENLALDQKNVSFSHSKDNLGGALSAYGTTWTVGSLVAQSAGLPLKYDALGIDGNGYGDKYKQFLPGAYTLADILEKEGYNQTFLMGSQATFGGRDKFLSQHGNYLVKDYTYAQENGLIDPGYYVWWGYEDKKLIEFTKAEILRLSQLENPFNVQMLTVDTHFIDGWLDPGCETKHDAQYDNVYACSSKLINEFVSWVQAQPFADNTTIIISGDHIGMQTEYFDDLRGSDQYERTTYNVFINPAVSPVRNNKERLFTAYDMYPSTLAAMGVVLPNDQLALGVNLFSEKQTLLEQYGNLLDFNKDLQKRSDFYNSKIIYLK